MYTLYLYFYDLYIQIIPLAEVPEINVNLRRVFLCWLLRKYFDTHFWSQCVITHVITGLWLALPIQQYQSLYIGKTLQPVPKT
jgi:hypothetical protein